jgi:cyclophilin family peptidyl-prolyl cis-trans isomerase
MAQRAVSGVLGNRGVVARAASGLERRGASNYGWLTRYYDSEARRQAAAAAWAAAPALPPARAARPRAFFEFAVEGKPAGRVTVELAADLLPQTCDNFLRLCAGVQGKAFGRDMLLGYKGSQLNRIYKGAYLQLGDFIDGRGRTGHSALGRRFFADEGFLIPHAKPGLLTMVKGAVDENSSIFCVTLKPLPHLDGRNVVFGHVTEGMKVITALSEEFQVKGKPVAPVVIADCGVLH